MKNHWVVLRNSWFKHFGICECDIILLMNMGNDLFEVKNYSSDITYNTGLCYLNRRKIKQNAVTQLEKARFTLKDICNERSPNIDVRAIIVFTGIDCEVDIRTSVDDLEVVARNQLKRHIIEIVEKEKQLKCARKLPVDLIIKYVEKYITSNPFLPEPLTPHEIS